jgi:hypothetical protein
MNRLAFGFPSKQATIGVSTPCHWQTGSIVERPNEERVMNAALWKLRSVTPQVKSDS